VTGINDPVAGGIPSEYTLHQNYPNPFNPRTLITYELPRAAHVTLKLYDVFGREVASVVDEFQNAGHRSVEWNATDVASGVYFYELTAGSFRSVKKMTLLK